MDQNEKGLLEVLIQRGLVPSFAFPLDVCTFTVRESGEGETKLTVNTSQDMRVALNSFVPGNYLTIDKKTYLSHGMTATMIPNNPESIINRVEHIFNDQDKYFENYNFCNSCDTVFKELNSGDEENKPCPICKVSDGSGSILTKKILKPDGFAPQIVPVDQYKKERTNGRSINGYLPMEAIDQTRQTNTGSKFRARAKFPSPYLSNDDDANQQLIWESSNWQNIKVYSMQKDGIEGEGTELVVANRGSGDGGWSICNSCGLVALTEKDKSGEHNRPYSISPEETRRFPEDQKEELINASKRLCNGKWSDGLYFGFNFRTDLIFFRIKLTSPLDMSQRLSATMKGAVSAIKESLITETTHYLKLVDREIEGGYRHISLPREGNAIAENTSDEYIDIFLFDAVSGGAGLVDQLDSTAIERILQNSESRLKGNSCHGGTPCQRACIGCLLDFRNSTEHPILNRIHGYELLKYIQSSEPPSPNMLNENRLKNLIHRFQKLDSSLNFEAKDDGPLYEITDSNGEKLILHFHSILTFWEAEGIVNSSQGFAISETQRPVDRSLICCIPYEVARDSPAEVINRIHQYFRPRQNEIAYEELF